VPDRRSPGGLEAWFVVPLLLSLGTSGVAPMLLPLEVVRIEGSALHVGTVMAAIGAGLVTAPYWGRLAHRRRAHRGALVGGSLAIAVGLGGFCFTRDWHEWVALAFVMGAGVGAAFTAASLVIASRFAAGGQDAAFGWLQTLTTVGTVLGLFLAGAVTHWELREEVGFAAAAALAVVAAALARGLLPPEPAPGPAAGSEIAAPTTTAPAVVPPDTEPTLPGRRSGLIAFGLLLAAWTASMLGVNAVSALYPLLMHQEFRIEPEHSSYALAVMTFLSLGLFLPASRLTAARGGLAVLQGSLTVRVAALGLLAYLAVTPGLALPWLAIVAFGVYTLVWPLLSVASTILVTRLGAVTLGAGPGLANAAVAVAGLAGPVVGGHVADRFTYEAVWIFGAASVAAGLLLTLPLLAFATRAPRAAPATPQEGATNR
jgi:MFS family permease